MLDVNVRYTHDDAKRLVKIEQGDWIDVSARFTYDYLAGQSIKVHLGFAMDIPEGYEAQLVVRSSTFDKYGVIQTNSLGIIDNSFSGDGDIWKLPLYSLRAGHISAGDRIAQFRLVPKMPDVRFNEVETLGNDNRGGFGTTGVK